MPGDTAILKDGLNQGKVEKPAGGRGGAVESPMYVADGFPSFLADIVDMNIPR